MEKLFFYGDLGFFHVLDPNGYDHVLFLTALALPFGFSQWRRVFWLATLFTVTHCFSLALAAYGLVAIDSGIIEFLIPVTILLTALYNIYLTRPQSAGGSSLRVHLLSTAGFGLIHGFGFSNYFGMLMSGETAKTGPLFGFAFGIEVAQLLVLLGVMAISSVFIGFVGLERNGYIRWVSILIAGVSAVLIYNTWPFQIFT